MGFRRKGRGAPIKKFWLPSLGWYMPGSYVNVPDDATATTPTNAVAIPLVGDNTSVSNNETVLQTQDKAITIDRIVGRVYCSITKRDLGTITGAGNLRFGFSLMNLPLDPAGTPDSIGVDAAWHTSFPDQRFRILHQQSGYLNLALLASTWAAIGQTTTPIWGLNGTIDDCGIVDVNFGKMDLKPRISVMPNQQLCLVGFCTIFQGSFTTTGGGTPPQIYFNHDLRILAHRKVWRR